MKKPPAKWIKVMIDLPMLAKALDQGYDTHRQVVEREFLLKDYKVIDHSALRYFALYNNANKPYGFIIEGLVGVAVGAR